MDIDDRMYKLNLNNKYETSNSSATIHNIGGTDGGNNGSNINSSGGKVTHLVQQLQQQACDVANQQHSKGFVNASTPIASEGFYMKKVGPSVPPKPNKKKQQTLVTCNNNAKSTYECLYETAALAGATNSTAKSKMVSDTNRRDNVDIVSNKLSTKLLPCKPQALCTAAGSICHEKTFNAKITLDIPVVLDQQLEALTHHKMQLEKRGLLQQQERKNSKSLQQSHSNNLNTIPKLSSTSLLAKDIGVGIYTNLPIVSNNSSATTKTSTPTQPTASCTDDLHKMRLRSMEQNMKQDNSSCYINLPIQQQEQDQLYTNMFNNQEQNVNLPASLPVVKTLNLADLAGNIHQLIHNQDDDHKNNCINDDEDDEIPPPPSPVSSSYSELRRATTNNTNLFSVMPSVATTTTITTATNQYTSGLKQNPQEHPQSLRLTPQQHDEKKPHYSLNANKMQNAYMNVHYNNDYNNTYSPTLQSLSQTSTDYYGYSSFSQGTSTYESIYEPINLRPTSQMSLTNSNSSLAYAASSGGYQIDGNNSSNGINTNNDVSSVITNKNQIYKNQEPYEHQLHDKHHASLQQPPPEAEVEALTNFLVHSMQPNNVDDDDNIQHDENYGICFKCNERIFGETSGCTAMDQTYHIACFTCSQCQINLQGKPFYALDGKPYCEYDYLQTLEKCSVCMKPILERILRATGKPYHPQCFTCIVCNKSLDGIPFTVDATNQNYCIADFHKKFAPRCCVCKEPIMPAAGEEETVRVVALDRSFHFECYKCEDCGLLLSSEADGRGCYPLDDHVLCKSCNANRVQMLTNRMTTEL